MNSEFATEFGKTPEEMFAQRGWVLKGKRDHNNNTDYELIHNKLPRATFSIYDRYDYFYKLGCMDERLLGHVREYRKRVVENGSVVYQNYSFFRDKWWMILDVLQKVVDEIVDGKWVRDWNYVEPSDPEFCLPRIQEPSLVFSQHVQDPPNKYRGRDLYPCRKCGRSHIFIRNPYRSCSNCVKYAIECDGQGLSLEDRCDEWECECGSPHTWPSTCLPEENRPAEYRRT